MKTTRHDVELGLPKRRGKLKDIQLTTTAIMNAILFQLKKLNENHADENKWNAASDEIYQLQTTGENIFCGRQGCLLIRDGSASPLLAKAISFAANRNLAYSLTFFEHSTEWNFDSQPVKK